MTAGGKPVTADTALPAPPLFRSSEDPQDNAKEPLTMAKLSLKPSLPLFLSGCFSSLVLLVGMTPTFGAFTASLSAIANNARGGTIVMQESDSSGTVTCLSTDGGGLSTNTATCSAINRYGGNVGMQPGEGAVTATYIRNVGSLAASSFALTPGACVQSAPGPVSGSATDLCSKISVSITSGSATIFSGTAAGLGSVGAIDVLAQLGLPRFPAGYQAPFTVTTRMDAAVDNSYQGLMVSQPMTWTFSA
jgi:hypothetical protein